MTIDNAEIINNKNQLVAYMEACAKPKRDWKIGLEYEIFAYDAASKKPLDYEGTLGIKNLFTELQKQGWTAQHESGFITKLYNGFSNISLEPGGQLELSSTPHENMHQVYNELSAYTEQLTSIGDALGISYLTLGFHPEWNLHEIPKMPNPNNRYNIIAHYLGQVGKHGIDMMYRTCSAQASLDYGSESDMVKKYRVSLALQPILTALVSNSPFIDGSPSNYLSARSHAWSNANPRRTGMFPVIFEEGFSFERYVDYALDLPLYLIFRDGKYIDAHGQPFRKFLEGSLTVLPGQLPTLNDWQNHIGTLWPEVRLKNVLEIRGADSGPVSRVCALTAITTGLLYEQSSLDAAWDIVKTWDSRTRNCLYREVIHEGFKTVINKNITAKDIAKEILDIASAGLKTRNQNEAFYLDSAYEILESGQTPANVLIQNYYGKWQNSINIEELNPF
jgi:glutamate--cysteine ligase